MSWLPDWLTGYDAENAARARKADDEIRRLNAIKIDDGTYTKAQADKINADFSTDATFTTDESARDSIDQQFAEGLGDGVDNIKRAVNGTFTGILGSIPWSVWLIVAVLIFVWMGGLSQLKGRFQKA